MWVETKTDAGMGLHQLLSAEFADEPLRVNGKAAYEKSAPAEGDDGAQLVKPRGSMAAMG